MNAWEKTVDVLIAVLLLFLIPLLYYGGGIRVSRAVLAGQASETFLRRVSTSGEITLPVWKELEDALTRYGCDGFELQRERVLYEPTGESGTVTECIYSENKAALFHQVLRAGKSRLQRGDRLYLTVTLDGIPTVYYDSVRTGATGG